MSSHTGTNFLNSCLKVPIDPCNNRPAPVYNRPKVYLGRSATATSKVTTTSKVSDYDLDLDALFATSEVRSLAKFYDSIPDYCELNHLPEEEFYSTLETLKSTCRTLKSKPSPAVFVRNDSSQSFASSQSCHMTKACRSRVHGDSSSKRSKRRPTSKKFCAKKDCRSVSASPCVSSYRNLCERMRILSYKWGDDLDVEKVSERPRRTPSRDFASLRKSLSVCHLPKDEIKPEESVDEKIKETNAKLTQRSEEKLTSKFEKRSTGPTRPKTKAGLDFLKKSFSFNDLHSPCLSDDGKRDSATMFRQYLDDKLKTPRTIPDEVPKISVQSPVSPVNLKVDSAKASSSRSTSSSRKKKAKSKKRDSTRLPFSFLGINECKLADKLPSASPVHPVARPNLAATLRAEVSKKKLKELQSNCTFTDQTTPQVDWEVRKTPAWKSLGLNESHKEILALRLATRKAEQALQKREYELHMELMKQRVKSAPLLLEGTTYWGPHVGKLTHSCYKDSLRHPCQNEKKTRRKNNSSKSKHRNAHSRNSNHSTNMHDSDDLCSLDRAYL